MTQTCDICGHLVHEESTDIMITTTTYDEGGEVISTMENAPEECGPDYLVTCKSCKVYAVSAWKELVQLFTDPKYKNGQTN